MLARVTRRILTRAARPAVATRVDVGEETHPAFSPFAHVFRRGFSKATIVKIDHQREFASNNRFKHILAQFQPILCQENVDSSVEIQAESENSAELSSYDLTSLLRDLPPLPPNEFRQVYEFDRRTYNIIPMERYSGLGQYLSQSKIWSTHPSVWHSVGQSCRAH